MAPLVRVSDDLWFAHLLANLIWAIQTQFESALKREPPVWKRYESHRSRLLEDQSVALIKPTSPHFRSWQGLKYEFDDGEGTKIFELDGLLAVDRTLFLLEAKAGAVAPSARRGGELRLLENLMTLVGEAHQQALRARRFLDSRPEAVFLLPDGTELRIRRVDFTRVLMVTTTLDHLSAFLTRISGLVELGVIPAGVLPWSVYWDDLRVICELTPGAGQLVHYLERRSRIETQPLHAHDELDWFGHYLSEGLYFKESDADITLQTYTTELDDYFLYKAGVRQTVTQKPAQFMPPAFRELIELLEKEGPRGFIDAVCMLLDANGRTRELIAERVAISRERAREKFFSGFRMQLEDRVLTYCAMRTLSPWWVREHVAAGKYESRVNAAVGIGQSATNPRELVVVVERYPWIKDQSAEAAMNRFFMRIGNVRFDGANAFNDSEQG